MEKQKPVKGTILPTAALITVCMLICLLSFQRLVVGCMLWDCVDSGRFDPQEIQIPREYFPDDAVYGELGSEIHPEGARQRDSQTVWWGTDSSRVILTVVRFPGTSRAKNNFAFEARSRKQSLNIPSGQPNDLAYQSATANQMFIGCGRLASRGANCSFVARYNEDLIELIMSIDEQMTQEDFERIIIYLDTVAALRLGH